MESSAHHQALFFTHDGTSAYAGDAINIIKTTKKNIAVIDVIVVFIILFFV